MQQRAPRRLRAVAKAPSAGADKSELRTRHSNSTAEETDECNTNVIRFPVPVLFDSCDATRSDLLPAEIQRLRPGPMQPTSLLAPIGYSSSRCGYCGPPKQRRRQAEQPQPQEPNGDESSGQAATPSKPPKTSRSYGCWGHDLSPHDYERMMMQNNWRRSGRYLYKPDNLRTCCPQLTIR